MTEAVGVSNEYDNLVTEQVEFFRACSLLARLPSFDLLQSEVTVVPVYSDSMYRNYAAEFEDDPKTDTITATVEVATIEDMADEFSREAGLSELALKRLYVGTGLANLLIVRSFAGPTRTKRIQKFFGAISESCGLYAQSMDSPIFDNIQADETAAAIAAEGHQQTANVNAIRLSTGMFIEAQPDKDQIRSDVEEAFQDELKELFEGKVKFIRNVGLFKIKADTAKTMHANNVEVLMGLALPMRKPEIKELLGLLR